MDNRTNHAVFRRTLLTASILMAMSTSAQAVTLDQSNPVLSGDVSIVAGTGNTTGLVVDTGNSSDKSLNVSTGGFDIDVSATQNYLLATGLEVKGGNSVVIDANGSRIEASGDGNYASTGMQISSSGDVTLKGGDISVTNANSSAYGIRLVSDSGNTLNLDGTTINAQGKLSSTAIDVSHSYSLNTDINDTINLTGSSIEHGNITTGITVAGSNDSAHSLQLNLKEGSQIGGVGNKLAIISETTSNGSANVNDNTIINVDGSSALFADVDVRTIQQGKGEVYSSASMNLSGGAYWEGDARVLGTGTSAMFATLTERSQWKGSLATAAGATGSVSLDNANWQGSVANSGDVSVDLMDSNWTGDISGSGSHSINSHNSVWNGGINSNGTTLLKMAGSTWEGELSGNGSQTLSLHDSLWKGNAENDGLLSLELSGAEWNGNLTGTGETSISAMETLWEGNANIDGTANIELTHSNWTGDLSGTGNTTISVNSSGWEGHIDNNNVASVELSGSDWKGGLSGTGNSTVSLSGSRWTGDVDNNGTALINLNRSEWAGDLSGNGISALSLSDSVWKGTSAGQGNQAISLKNGSYWNVTGKSSTGSLSLDKSTLDVSGASLAADTLQSSGSTLIVDAGTTNALNVTGVASGDLTVHNAGSVILRDPATAVITVGAGSSLDAKGTTENGLYQYELMKGADGGFRFISSGRTPSGVSTMLQSLSAATANMANLQADTLSGRQDEARLSTTDNGGFWARYYGGKQRNTTAGYAAYELDVNGVMLGGDTRINTEDGSWLAGVAFSSAKGNVTSLRGSGESEGYSVHAYLTRQYDNGFFIDFATQLGRYNNGGDVQLLNSMTNVHASYDNFGFGASVKGGYTWKDASGLFVEPYFRLSALTLSDADYKVSETSAHTDSYSSVKGETGTRMGYEFSAGNTVFRPYLRMAALTEFADSNKVSLGQEHVNASVDGAAFRIGGGVQADITQNLGAYASLDYTSGDNMERPLQGYVGVNFTW
ncbi:autotransporter outer membrane beta-barrel domain-containing protein [Citrobacter freundii]|uniref:autotransporter outer membrane beta-barrel domain-containing protein n=1 Tax=Citrobacter freundii TaxID=546 RepID=UPI001902A76F|nr:autotransporter outer membrane beta-barrel domain-containing protein [Citrobacter freundii]MBJ9181225.1 autotransporter outer membrane beta-barrel domain-containing protein [Citrobacter freundii]